MRPGRPTVSHRALAVLGLAGAAIISLASTITVIAFVGAAGERYSPLSHWISELGEIGESELAILFNLGLLVGAPLLALFMVGLGRIVGDGWGGAIAVAGVIAGVAGALVGVFTMDDAATHGPVALTFFLAGPVAVGLFTVWLMQVRPVGAPRSLVWPGLFTVVCGVVFLVLLFTGDPQGLAAPTDRQDIWPLAIFEWLTLVGILAWVVAVSAVLWQSEPPKRP